jgi:hypothetical protein
MSRSKKYDLDLETQTYILHLAYLDHPPRLHHVESQQQCIDIALETLTIPA